MRWTKTLLIAGTLPAMAIGANRQVVVPPTGAVSVPMPPPAQASDEGKALFEGACGGCHGVKMVTEQRKSNDEWAATVNQMIGRGAPLDEGQAALVTAYLVSHYASP